jgi:hypothetical protein
VRFPERFFQAPPIEVLSQGQGARQSHVTYKLRAILLESRSAKDVIRMNVGHHHVFDRQLGNLSDRRAQPFTVDQASSRVDHRDGLATNDESDVGYPTFILRSRVLVNTTSDVDPRRDLIRNKHPLVRRLLSRASPDATKARARHEGLTTRYWRWDAHVSTIGQSRRDI